MSAQDDVFRIPRQRASFVDRYDVLLAAIPLAFTFGTGGALAIGESLPVGFRIGALLAALTTAYALFGTPPNGGRSPFRGPA